MEGLDLDVYLGAVDIKVYAISEQHNKAYDRCKRGYTPPDREDANKKLAFEGMFSTKSQLVKLPKI